MANGATPIAAIVPSCPKRGDMRVSQCMNCPYFRGLEGAWPQVKVKCALSPAEPREVELLVACPLKGEHVKFKTCLTCPLHRGFYGFHNNSPVVYCGLRVDNEEERRRRALTPLLIAYR